MDDLIGKTVVAVEDLGRRGDWHECWRITCADGAVFLLESHGGSYCSSSLSLKPEQNSGR